MIDVLTERIEERLELLLEIQGAGAYVKRAQRVAGDLLSKGIASNVSAAAGAIADWLHRNGPKTERQISTALPHTLAQAWAALTEKKDEDLEELDWKIRQDLMRARSELQGG